MTDLSPYLAAVPDLTASVRIFCFHEGGGSAASFGKWTDAFGPDVSIVPIQLPGHGNRAGEPFIPDRNMLLDELNNDLGELLDKPYILYAQCAGTPLAHGLARKRMSQGERMPERLIVGACKAPHLSADWVQWALDWPDERLTQFFLELGTVSPLVAGHSKWMQPILARARYDGELIRDYYCSIDEPLGCPIDAFAGDDDILTLQDMEQWRFHTTAEFSAHVVPGSHLFNVEMGPGFATKLGEAILQCAPPR
jgi:surfactin synthase thioesterase subunit